MHAPFLLSPDPTRDLVLEREIAVSVDLVWKAWTIPEHMLQWFTPKPWKTVECSVDLRPGGRCVTVMESPEGERFPNTGCYLVVEPNRRLVFTSALGEGFRPLEQDAAGFPFVGDIRLERTATGTRYTAVAIHATAADAAKHQAMGFHEGWGKALDQLVEWASTQR